MKTGLLEAFLALVIWLNELKLIFIKNSVAQKIYFWFYLRMTWHICFDLSD